MKERHKSLVGTWQETTDPLKHVFEVKLAFLISFEKKTQRFYQDVGIATFLMLLWKEMYKTADSDSGQAVLSLEDESEALPWDPWPRPPGGFVDVG